MSASVAQKVLVADVLGFCFGVQRAIETIEHAAAEEGPLESLGAIVHNQQVIDRLAARGVRQVGDVREITGTKVAITAHGAGPGVYETIRQRGLGCIDTTCPFVQTAHVFAQRLGREGFTVVVYGEADHPEVRGTLGWAGAKAHATLDPNFASTLRPRPRRLAILSQTTQSPQHFHSFAERQLQLIEGLSEFRVVNTICDATIERQAAALKLARQAHVVVVIGGHTSANTRHLAELCHAEGVETHHIENESELDPAWLHERRYIGVTAGASTPDDVIQAVVNRLHQLADA